MNLDRIDFFPCTLRFCVNAAIDHAFVVMLDLEQAPPVLIFEGPTTATTGGVETREATEVELIAIEEWLATVPSE